MGEQEEKYVCDLCKLNFSTEQELKEHDWSLLHHRQLDKEKGRDAIHTCTLCEEDLFGLLAFTKHIHSEKHTNEATKLKYSESKETSHLSTPILMQQTSEAPNVSMQRPAVGTLPLPAAHFLPRARYFQSLENPLASSPIDPTMRNFQRRPPRMHRFTPQHRPYVPPRSNFRPRFQNQYKYNRPGYNPAFNNLSNNNTSNVNTSPGANAVMNTSYTDQTNINSYPRPLQSQSNIHNIVSTNFSKNTNISYSSPPTTSTATSTNNPDIRTMINNVMSTTPLIPLNDESADNPDERPNIRNKFKTSTEEIQHTSPKSIANISTSQSKKQKLDKNQSSLKLDSRHKPRKKSQKSTSAKKLNGKNNSVTLDSSLSSTVDEQNRSICFTDNKKLSSTKRKERDNLKKAKRNKNLSQDNLNLNVQFVLKKGREIVKRYNKGINKVNVKNIQNTRKNDHTRSGSRTSKMSEIRSAYSKEKAMNITPLIDFTSHISNTNIISKPTNFDISAKENFSAAIAGKHVSEKVEILLQQVKPVRVELSALSPSTLVGVSKSPKKVDFSLLGNKTFDPACVRGKGHKMKSTRNEIKKTMREQNDKEKSLDENATISNSVLSLSVDSTNSCSLLSPRASTPSFQGDSMQETSEISPSSNLSHKNKNKVFEKAFNYVVIGKEKTEELMKEFELYQKQKELVKENTSEENAECVTSNDGFSTTLADVLSIDDDNTKSGKDSEDLLLQKLDAVVVDANKGNEKSNTSLKKGVCVNKVQSADKEHSVAKKDVETANAKKRGKQDSSCKSDKSLPAVSTSLTKEIVCSRLPSEKRVETSKVKQRFRRVSTNCNFTNLSAASNDTDEEAIEKDTSYNASKDKQLKSTQLLRSLSESDVFDTTGDGYSLQDVLLTNYDSEGELHGGPTDSDILSPVDCETEEKPATEHCCEFKKKDGSYCDKFTDNRFCEYHQRVLKAVELFVSNKVASGSSQADAVSLIDLEESDLDASSIISAKRSLSEASDGSDVTSEPNKRRDMLRFNRKKSKSICIPGETASDSSVPHVVVSAPNISKARKQARFKYLRSLTTTHNEVHKSNLPPTVRKLLDKKSNGHTISPNVPMLSSSQSESENEIANLVEKKGMKKKSKLRDKPSTPSDGDVHDSAYVSPLEMMRECISSICGDTDVNQIYTTAVPDDNILETLFTIQAPAFMKAATPSVTCNIKCVPSNNTAGLDKLSSTHPLSATASLILASVIHSKTTVTTVNSISNGTTGLLSASSNKFTNDDIIPLQKMVSEVKESTIQTSTKSLYTNVIMSPSVALTPSACVASKSSITSISTTESVAAVTTMTPISIITIPDDVVCDTVDKESANDVPIVITSAELTCLPDEFDKHRNVFVELIKDKTMSKNDGDNKKCNLYSTSTGTGSSGIIPALPATIESLDSETVTTLFGIKGPISTLDSDSCMSTSTSSYILCTESLSCPVVTSPVTVSSGSVSVSSSHTALISASNISDNLNDTSNACSDGSIDAVIIEPVEINVQIPLTVNNMVETDNIASPAMRKDSSENIEMVFSTPKPRQSTLIESKDNEGSLLVDNSIQFINKELSCIRKKDDENSHSSDSNIEETFATCNDIDFRSVDKTTSNHNNENGESHEAHNGCSQDADSTLETFKSFEFDEQSSAENVSKTTETVPTVTGIGTSIEDTNGSLDNIIDPNESTSDELESEMNRLQADEDESLDKLLKANKTLERLKIEMGKLQDEISLHTNQMQTISTQKKKLLMKLRECRLSRKCCNSNSSSKHSCCKTFNNSISVNAGYPSSDESIPLLILKKQKTLGTGSNRNTPPSVVSTDNSIAEDNTANDTRSSIGSINSSNSVSCSELPSEYDTPPNSLKSGLKRCSSSIDETSQSDVRNTSVKTSKSNNSRKLRSRPKRNKNGK